MKKMILVAAIVCAATITHAASCIWTMSAIAASETTQLADGAMTAFFMDGSTYDAFAALDSSKVAGFVTANNLSSAGIKVARGVASASGTFGSFSPNDKVAGYLVIFDNATPTDASYYAYTTAEEKTVPGSGNLAFSKSFAAASSGWQKIEATTPTPPGPTPDVPEPTSGLLLVLGGAALALRRRR